MRLTKKQNHKDRMEAIKELMKTDELLIEIMNEVYDLYEDYEGDLEEDLIKDYLRCKNTEDGHVIKPYSEELLMKARSINARDFRRFISINWIEAVTTDQPWFDEDRLCEEMGCDQIYVGDGMWWDNVNKRHYCEK